MSLGMSAAVLQETNAKIELKVLRELLREMLMDEGRREITRVERIIYSDANLTSF